MNKGIPKAYELGYQDFYGRDFKVSPDVLIPRPETEQLIDDVLRLSGKAILPGVRATKRVLKEHPLIIDVGTGSGCIAVTLSLELLEAKIMACDISSEALKIAEENNQKLSGRVVFFKSDLLENYHGAEPEVVVANLPYVDKKWEWLDREALAAEPELALYAEENGLALIKKLLSQIYERGWKSYVILEMDTSEQDEIISYAKGLGFSHKRTDGFVVELKK